jgi:hypothetical protein
LIKSRTTRRFRELFAALPKEIQREARDANRLFNANPNHRTLRFKKVEGTRHTYSARVSLGYRVLGILRADVIDWHWIGGHAEYDRLT